MPHTEPPEDCQLCKNAVQYYNTKGDAVDKKEDAVSRYTIGDRVRVTYDTVVLNTPLSALDAVQVKTPMSIERESEGRNGPGSFITVPVQYLTHRGPESDPVGTTRIRHGKEFAVAVRRSGQEGTTCDWRIVAAKDQTQVGLYLNNYLVKDWDVLGA